MSRKYERSATSKQFFQLELLNDEQKRAYEIYKENDISFFIGAPGSGKALTLDSKIYTPDGYKLMGEIKINDTVCTPNGTTAKVIGVYPQGVKDIYRITFHDGSSVECCKEHLWEVSKRSRWKNKIVNTEFILNNYKNKKNERMLSIKTTKPVCFKEQEYFIHPYIMGIILSEGNITHNNLTITTNDEQVINKVKNLLHEDFKIIQDKCRNNSYRIVKKKKSWQIKNKYKEELKEMGMWGKRSYEKSIPEKYLYGSTEQRIALLQGLMDGDGIINKGAISYCTTSSELAENFTLLVNSLGGTCGKSIKKNPFYRKDGVKILCRKAFNLSVKLSNEIPIFSLDRKNILRIDRTKYFPKRYIENVEYIGKKEAQCIAVDSDEHLYLTNDFIVTHNTFLATAFAIQDIRAKERSRIVLTRPVVESGENLGFLPGDVNEKVYPYMLPMYDCLDKLCGKDSDFRRRIDECYEIAPLAYLRGRSLQGAVCILDEAQNCTKTQLKLFLTRLDKYSKMIITGDPSQIDLPRNQSGLMEVIEKLRGVKGIGCIHFTEEAIVRHPLVKEISKLL